jgi:hypothetical protein
VKPILPDIITIEPEDAYIAVLNFLDTYNEELQSDELRSLVGEMIQVGIAQSTYRLWLETFREVLMKSGTLKEASDQKTILPDIITLHPVDAYKAIILFLERYNENLQADELKDLVNKLTLVDTNQSTYQLWLKTFKNALIQSHALEDTES